LKNAEQHCNGRRPKVVACPSEVCSSRNQQTTPVLLATPFGAVSAIVFLAIPMNDQVQLDGILFSTDLAVLSVMNPILDSFGIKTEVYSDLNSTLDAVSHRRMDTVIVDWDDAHSPIRVVRAARKSSPNSNSTIVAVVSENCEMQAALLAGVNFLIHKPTNHDHASRCMRAAYGTMLQQRRRVARCTVDIPLIATVAELGKLEARVSDISVGGLRLLCPRPLEINWTVSLSLVLPATHDVIHVTGKVVNTDKKGRVGICFSGILEAEFNLLVNWLATELAKLETAEIPVSQLLEG
jgi:PilZ domain